VLTLGRKQKMALRLAGYAAFFLASFLLFLFLLFPFNRWKGTMEELLSKELDRKVTIGSVGAWGLTGLKLRDVTIEALDDERELQGARAMQGKRAKADDAKQKKVPLHLDSLGVRLAVLPALTGKLGVCFKAKLFGGKITGCYVDASRSITGKRKDIEKGASGPRSSVKIKIRNIDLREVEQLESLTGLPFHGDLDGTIKLTYVPGSASTAAGKADVEIGDLQIGDEDGKLDLAKAGQGMLAGEVNFEPIIVGDLDMLLEGEAGVLSVEKLESQSSHMEIKGTGDVVLKEPLLSSQLNLYVMFKFLPDYINKTAMTKTIFSSLDRLPKMRQAKRPDGFFGFALKGDLRSGPSPLPARAGPGTSSAGQPRGGQGLPMGLGKKKGKGPSN